MRLLFDENLSEALLPALNDLYPNSLHVRTLNAGGASDLTVWQIAKDQGCVLVTRDEDVVRLSLLRGAPPKVVRLAIGRCTNGELIRLLRHRHVDLLQFVAHDDAAFLALRS